MMTTVLTMLVMAVAAVLLNAAVLTVIQLNLNRRVLRGAAQPEWGQNFDAMWGIHDAFGITARHLAPLTMRLSARLWPPAG